MRDRIHKENYTIDSSALVCRLRADRVDVRAHVGVFACGYIPVAAAPAMRYLWRLLHVHNRREFLRLPTSSYFRPYVSDVRYRLDNVLAAQQAVVVEIIRFKNADNVFTTLPQIAFTTNNHVLFHQRIYSTFT